MNSLNVIVYLAIAITVVQAILYVWIASWILRVSRDPRCECAHNWRKNYLLVFPIVSFAIQLITASGLLSGTYHHIMSLLYLPLFIGWVLFIVFGIQYLSTLHHSRCDCATQDRTGDNALVAYMAIKVSVFLLAFIAHMLFTSMFTAVVVDRKTA